MKKIFKAVKYKIRAPFSNYRQRQLVNNSFSIISDNCWGSFTYQHFNLPYNTPFVGLFLFSPDYLKLIKDLKRYTELEIDFIEPTCSKYKDELIKDNTLGTYPIGVIGDIEIHFLHYVSIEEARKKWNERVKRINFNNLIIKFCDRDLATEELIQEFLSLPYENKVLLTAQNYDHPSALKLKNESGLHVKKEWENYKKTVCPVSFINDLYINKSNKNIKTEEKLTSDCD